MSEKRPRRLFYAAVALSVWVAKGCGKAPNRQPAEKAEAAVEEFLESWSKGEPHDKFVGTHPKISASDPDWKAGYRLSSFLSVESKQSQEEPPRFRCRVALSLRDRKGKAVEKEVVYEILSGEKYVISRAQR
jgi:hypothetical protein